MTSITDRYASAVRATSLKPTPGSMAEGTRPAATATALDVLGAYGLMASKYPLAAALTRLLEGGDNHASLEVVQHMAAVVEGRAYRTGVEITRLQAEDMARAVLAWHRNGTCRPCHGHGFDLIEGAPSLSGNHCKACHGTGKRPFAREFVAERQELAQWVLAKVERELALAGPAAMAKLAPKLDF